MRRGKKKKTTGRKSMINRAIGKVIFYFTRVTEAAFNVETLL
jgi:hypothetical protein